jgi:hypothetical protein
MKQNLTKTDVRNEANPFNAEVMDTEYIQKPKIWQFNVNAPEGYEWADGGSLSLVCIWDGSIPGAKKEAFKDLIQRMRCGLEQRNYETNP